MDFPLYSENRYLTLTEMRGNAQFIMSFFHDAGWTKNAIAAMLGNMQVESTINPGIWQGMDEFDYDGGFGLVQWTPASKYIDWAATIGLILMNFTKPLPRNVTALFGRLLIMIPMGNG